MAGSRRDRKSWKVMGGASVRTRRRKGPLKSLFLLPRSFGVTVHEYCGEPLLLVAVMYCDLRVYAVAQSKSGPNSQITVSNLSIVWLLD